MDRLVSLWLEVVIRAKLLWHRFLCRVMEIHYAGTDIDGTFWVRLVCVWCGAAIWERKKLYPGQDPDKINWILKEMD